MHTLLVGGSEKCPLTKCIGMYLLKHELEVFIFICLIALMGWLKGPINL